MTDLFTLAWKETHSFLRIWKQTLVPSVITTVLYILIFGKFLGGQISEIEGVAYINYIFPGLLMMSIIMGSYALTSFGFFAAKMFKSLEELLISPITNNRIIIAYCIAGLIRGTIVGFLVYLSALFMVEIQIYSYSLLIVFIILTSIVFSLAGLLNGIFAKSFDDVNIIPSFVITPLIYLGGVFYSIEMLSPFWQRISQFNPIFYMINGLRHAFIGVSDVEISTAITILLVFTIILYSTVYYLLKIGKNIKS